MWQLSSGPMRGISFGREIADGLRWRVSPARLRRRAHFRVRLKSGKVVKRCQNRPLGGRALLGVSALLANAGGTGAGRSAMTSMNERRSFRGAAELAYDSERAGQ